MSRRKNHRRSLKSRNSKPIESLESRRLLAFASAFVDANTVGMLGSSSDEILFINTDGTNLYHNRKTAGDSGFASDFDFDTATSGVQLLADAPGVVLSIQAGDGLDLLSVFNDSGLGGALSIKSQIIFLGEGGTDTVFIDDSSSSVGKTVVFALSDGVISGFAGQPMAIQSTEKLTFSGSSGADTLVMDSSPLVFSSTIFGNNGDDNFVYNFNKNFGTNTFDGGGGTNTVIVDDALTVTNQIYLFYGNTVQRGLAFFTYSNTATVVANAGSGDDNMQVLSATSAPLQLDAKKGINSYLIGNGSINGFSKVNINGSGNVLDHHNITINDSSSLSANSYVLVNGTLVRNGTAMVSYSGVGLVTGPIMGVTLNAADLADTFNVAEFQSIPVTISGNGGDDLFLMDKAPNGKIFGGLGNDLLDYSNATGPITVDLSAGTATGTSGVSSIEKVNGSTLGDTLIGGTASVTIAGGDGADSITGSTLADQLFGDGGNDTVSGLGGADTIAGGANNDSIVGGAGDDNLVGDAGDDTFTHETADGSDNIEGGDNTDQVIINSSSAVDQFVVSDNGGSLSVSQISPVTYNLNTSTVEKVTVDGGLGADVFAVSGSPAGVQINLNGGIDTDAFIIGSDGLVAGIFSNVIINGGDGDDAVIVDDSNKTTSDIVTLTGTQIGHGAGDNFLGVGGAVSFSNVAIVNLSTPNASTGDRIKLTPSAAVVFELDGGTPVNPTIAGDKLSLDLAGIVDPRLTSGVDDSAGSINFANALPVNFASIEDLGAGVFKFTSPNFVVNENGVFAILTIQRILGDDGLATVDFSSSDGTATDGVDYSGQSLTFPFPNGVTQQSILIPISDDLLSEADETIALALSNATGNAILIDGQTESELKIYDNEPKPFAVISDVSLTEGNSGKKSFQFTVSLTEASGQDITIDYTTTSDTAVSPSDFDFKTGTFTFAPGETVKTITIQVNGDNVFESNEKFFVDLSNAQGAVLFNTRGTGTIVNDESGISSFTLIDAATDKDIMTLNNGAVLNLNALPTSLAIRANFDGSPKSVKFAFDANTNFRIDSTTPFSLFSETSGNYAAGTLSLGSHTLKASPYSLTNATGILGAAKTITFQVVRLATITRFVSVNAGTDVDIAQIADGAVIKKSQLPASWTIRAAYLGSPLSVRFALNANNNFRTDNNSPFSLFGDVSGNMTGGTLAVGSYTLTATPYSAANATGTVGAAKTIHFTVVA